MLPKAIVDTHLHIWDTRRLRYPWLAGSKTLNRPHTIQDYQNASAGAPITHMVFLQCDCDPAQRRDEIAYVKESAAVDPRIKVIVPYAPIEQGDRVREELEALAADPTIKGVRRIVQGEQDSAYCLRPDFVRGVQLLGDVGLHFEICINHTQMQSAVELTRKCPEVRFVLNHIGKPNIKEQVLSPWREHIAELAGEPNVWCKISGMVTEADRENWTRDNLRPYFDIVMDRFGPDRVMYGSDWPVTTLASTYDRWLSTLDNLADSCSDDEKDRLFRRNALAFYRLR